MTRDYCGNYIYRNGAIERIMMGNGFLQDSVYYVQVKDYQGNVRAVLDQNHNVVERNQGLSGQRACRPRPEPQRGGAQRLLPLRRSHQCQRLAAPALQVQLKRTRPRERP